MTTILEYEDGTRAIIYYSKKEGKTKIRWEKWKK